MKAFSCLTVLNTPPQIQERFVHFADRSKHVLLKNSRKIFTCARCFLAAQLNILEILDKDASPQHPNNHHSQYYRSPALRKQPQQLAQIFHFAALTELKA